MELSLQQFTRTTPTTEVTRFAEALRPYLSRCIACFNGKGGQGKTSVATHLAALFASAQAEQNLPGRVLIVDMDPQGNTLLDLGLEGHELVDRGASLVKAIVSGQSRDLNIIRDARPQLDLIPGGKSMNAIGAKLVGEQMERGRSALLGLAVILAQLSSEYDWIIIDCPPTFPDPTELSLIAARWALIPVSFDAGSVRGLEGVADLFRATEDLNPDLELLGAVLFGFEHRYYTDRKTGEKRPVGMWVESRDEVQKVLTAAGTDAPLFEAVIRSARAVAKSCRNRGQLTFELASSQDGPRWWEIKQGKKKGRVLPTVQAERVGEDYEDLAFEVMERIIQVEQELAV